MYNHDILKSYFDPTPTKPLPQHAQLTSNSARTTDLSDWTGHPQEDSNYAFDFHISHSLRTTLTSLSPLRGEIGGGSSPGLLHLEGKNGRRYQIDRYRLSFP